MQIKKFANNVFLLRILGAVADLRHRDAGINRQCDKVKNTMRAVFFCVCMLSVKVRISPFESPNSGFSCDLMQQNLIFPAAACIFHRNIFLQ